MAPQYWITDRDMGAGIPVLGDIKERIDRILDKISKVGYDQLTKEEKDFLFRHGGDI